MKIEMIDNMLNINIDGDMWVVQVHEERYKNKNIAIAKALKQIYYILMKEYSHISHNNGQLNIFEED